MPTSKRSNFLFSQLKLLLTVASWPIRYGRKGLRNTFDFITVWRSGEFDPHWYLANTTSVRTAGAHPLQHFILHGDLALNDPNHRFSTRAHKKKYFLNWKDTNAFVHYLKNRDKKGFDLKTGNDRFPKLNIVVVAWDLGHNPAGRALLLAEALARRHNVELWGAHFPRFGNKLWEPIRAHKNIRIRTWSGSDFPDYANQLAEQIQDLACDLVYLSKPRMPTMAFGLLAKHLHDIPIILDIDDYEPAFFPDANACSLSSAIEHSNRAGHSCPHDGEWTMAAEQLLGIASRITVSNQALAEKFSNVSGAASKPTIVPHIRDERIFVPSAKVRNRLRRKLGYGSKDRIVLFIGTPRMHKGLQLITNALEEIAQKNTHLLVIGTPADKEASQFFDECSSRQIKLLSNISFDELPSYLNVGDLVCLMQADNSAVSEFQLPAKLIDALAMEIPILVSDTPPLRPYIDAGLATLVQPKQLPQAVSHVFNNYQAFKAKAIKNRLWFLRECSYSAFESTFDELVESSLKRHVQMPEQAELLLSYLQRSSTGYTLAPQKKPSPIRYNIVYFWKQNDSGVYGRRQDMLVKYLLKDSRVGRITHFDLPMTKGQLNALQESALDAASDQSRLVHENSRARMSGRVSHSGRLHEYTFVHNETAMPIYNYVYDYADFVHNALQQSKACEAGLKTVFILCPRVPEFPHLLRRFRPHFVIADVIDNHLKWKQKLWPREELIEHYQEVLGCADLVITNNSENQREMQLWASKIHLIPNAGESFSDDDIALTPLPTELAALEGRPIVGYSGNLDSQRIDIDLIDALVQLTPQCVFVFIGSTHQNQHALTLDKHENVIFLGAKPYSDAIRYIAHFDAAIVPHKDTELTRVMDPLKLYVYLSVGVPVVSTEVAFNKALADRIHFGTDAKQFADHIGSIMQAKQKGEIRSSALEADECWPARVNTLLDLVDAQLHFPT